MNGLPIVVANADDAKALGNAYADRINNEITVFRIKHHQLPREIVLNRNAAVWFEALHLANTPTKLEKCGYRGLPVVFIDNLDPYDLHVELR